MRAGACCPPLRLSARVVPPGLGCGFLLALVAGCAPGGPVGTPLTDTWALAAPVDGVLTRLRLTFAADGRLETVRFELGDSGTLTNSAAAGRGYVLSDTVVIDGAFGGSRLTFTGTLAADGTGAGGTLRARIVVGDSTIVLDDAPAVFTRVP